MGEARFGRWTFCLAWASALVLLSQFGLNTLVTREAARDKGRANQVLIGALLTQLLFSATLGSVVFFAPNFGFDPESSAALRLIVPFVIAATTYSSFAALFRAFEWMLPILWLSTGGLLLQLLWSVRVLHAGGGVRELITVTGDVQMIQVALAAALWWFRLRPRAGPLRVTPRGVRQMVRQAFPFAVAGLVSAVQLRSSALMLGYLRGAAEVGWFGAAARFSESAKLIPNAISGAVFPALSAGGRGEAGQNIFRIFKRALIGLALGAALGLALLSRGLLGLAYGPSFLPAAWPLVWLALGLIPNLINGGVELYLYASGDEAYVTWLGVVGALVQVSASLPLIFLFGVNGAAIGMGLGEVAIWFPLRRRMKRLAGHHA